MVGRAAVPLGSGYDPPLLSRKKSNGCQLNMLSCGVFAVGNRVAVCFSHHTVILERTASEQPVKLESSSSDRIHNIVSLRIESDYHS